MEVSVAFIRLHSAITKLDMHERRQQRNRTACDEAVERDREALATIKAALVAKDEEIARLTAARARTQSSPC